MYNYHNKGSYGERKVDKILTDAHIKFYREFEYGGMIGPSGYPMRFDFYLPNKRIAIEVDGSQHYMVIGGNTEKADYQFKCDKLKNAYCLRANIKLYRVPTWELDNIYCFEQLTNDRFLVKDTDYAKNITVPANVVRAIQLKSVSVRATNSAGIVNPSNMNKVLKMDTARPQCEQENRPRVFYYCQNCGRPIRRTDAPFCYGPCKKKVIEKRDWGGWGCAWAVILSFSAFFFLAYLLIKYYIF